MTDKDKLITLLAEFGVGFTQRKGKFIVLEEGNEKIDGYGCFYTLFSFDDNGAFLNVGAWE